MVTHIFKDGSTLSTTKTRKVPAEIAERIIEKALKERKRK